MNADESRAVVARIWRAFEAGDLATVEASLHEDFVCEWPLTRERIAGRAAYIQVNRDYPGSGTLRIIRITGTAEFVISEVEAEWGEPSARVRELAVSLFEFHGGKVAKLTEYWAAPYDPPAWRGERFK